MSDETTQDPAAKPDDEFGERMRIGGDLGMHLCEHLWSGWDKLTLDGQDFEITGCEEVPGYEEDEDQDYVLIRRVSDGQVFEAEIDVNVTRALTVEEREKRRERAKELAGQMRLPLAADAAPAEIDGQLAIPGVLA